MKNGTASTKCVFVRQTTTELMDNAKFLLLAEATLSGMVSDANAKLDLFQSTTDACI